MRNWVVECESDILILFNHRLEVRKRRGNVGYRERLPVSGVMKALSSSDFVQLPTVITKSASVPFDFAKA
jgi:hypothetical protein